ncbi:MAG TPA: hypothetical protein VFN48_00565 [Solirubrobacteraceae bacterium]|nr:hypothetical protein [Solirubrobacteraceae bacterium]
MAIISLALVVSGAVTPFRLMESIGRTGLWFHHQDMDPPEQQPDPGLNDPAIPLRRLRGRG